MNAYFYYPGADERRFCYAKEPTYVCPLGDAVEDRAQKALRELVAGEQPPPEARAVTAAAHELSIDGNVLAGWIRNAHRRGGRRRRDGKLTDRCEACGRRMDRLGFRVWEERPYTEEELAESSTLRASRQLGQELFGNERLYKTVRSSFVSSKREAIQWARDESDISAKH